MKSTYDWSRSVRNFIHHGMPMRDAHMQAAEEERLFMHALVEKYGAREALKRSGYV